MATRATIEFSDDDYYKYYVYRHHDGFPENILKDLQDTIDLVKGRWSEPEVECLVTLFLASKWDYKKERCPDYQITSNFHGDESYRYYCKWNKNDKEWKFGVMPGYEDDED